MGDDIRGYLEQLSKVLVEPSFPVELHEELMSFFNEKLEGAIATVSGL